MKILNEFKETIQKLVEMNRLLEAKELVLEFISLDGENEELLFLKDIVEQRMQATDKSLNNGSRIENYKTLNISNEFEKLLASNNIQKIVDELNLLLKERRYDLIIPISFKWLQKYPDGRAYAYLFLAWSANGICDYKSALKYHIKALEHNSNIADLARNKSKYRDSYNEVNTACIGCGYYEYDVVNVTNQSISEDNKELINPIRVWCQCKKCGLVYANPKPSNEVLNEYYSIVAREKFGGIYGNIDDRFEFLVSMANKRLEKIEQYLDKRGTLLDIGTGIGLFVGVALDRDWNAEGLEFTPEDCEYALKNFQLKLLNENFYDFNAERQYDCVTLFEVIEHLNNPLADLKQIFNLVKPGGLFVLATPILDSLFGKKSKENNVFWNVVTHLSYFKRSVMIDYLHDAGFQILEINNSPEGMGRMEFYCLKV